MTPVDVSFTVDVGEVGEAEIRRAVERVLHEEGADLRLSVVIVDDERIHDLNRRFLDHDRPTDVIAFDLGDDGPGVDGEIVVSVTTARREARAREIEPSCELLLYCIHGTLHLLGYDDEAPEDRARMSVRQREILTGLGYETTEE